MSRREAGDGLRTDAGRVVHAMGNEPAAIVAASYGGIAGLLAANAYGGIARALVLFEPACFSIARGCPAVESHVAAMAPVFDVADDPSVSDAEFCRRFAAGMGMEGPPLPPDQIAASARVLEKLGFEREGTLRQDCIVNGEISDSFVFGLIRQDWTAGRALPQ